jgi:polyisoprenyl-phosphate glycosyltransferase
MRTEKALLLSVVVPVYNEAGGLAEFNGSLNAELKKLKSDYEVIYCNDGSTDKTAELIKGFGSKNPRIKMLSFSRNFGKEIATTAGIHKAGGQAILTLDADGQHPVELIPEFVQRWQKGAKVVIGIRHSNQGEGLVKRFGSSLFYKTFNRVTGNKLVPGSSDFRLIDSSVQQEFVRITERSRMTRVLIDWLGYQRDYIKFKANPRLSGEAGYSFKKLFKLFIDSIVSMSKSPLYISAYLGAVVLPISILIGLFMVVDALVGDPLNLNATGSAYLVVLLLFLVGVLLVSQGIIGLYLSHIHSETQNRPLYIIDKQRSVGFDE